MMKYVLHICVFVFVVTGLYGQTSGIQPVPALPLVANKIVYSGTKTVIPALNKTQLFANAEKWYKHNFQSADNTLTVIKADSGRLSGTGVIHLRRYKPKHADPLDIYFTIDLIVADGAYQYSVSNIYSFQSDTTKIYYSDMYKEEQYPNIARPNWSKEYRELMLNRMNDAIAEMLEELRNEM